MKENPIFLRTSSCEEILPDKKMALRFMGCKELPDTLEEKYEFNLSNSVWMATSELSERKIGF